MSPARSCGKAALLAVVAVLNACGEPPPAPAPHDHSAHGGHDAAASVATEADSAGATAERRLAQLVREAAPGSRVVIPAGTYTGETLVIDKPLEINGDGQAILDGEDARPLIVVRADDVTIRGLILRNVGTSHLGDRAAIRVENAKRCRIEDNRVENGNFGIHLGKVDGCEVRGNRLSATYTNQTSAGNGIHVWSSRGVRIADNVIHGYRDGIYFEFVQDSRASGNRSEHNLRYGLHFMFSHRCHYERNIFRSNRAGVAVMYTNHVEMLENEFAENRGAATFGLLLKDISDSRIAGNRFASNTVALYIEGSNRLTVSDNDFLRNGWAIRLMANSEQNEFRGNNFAGNTFDVAVNSRRLRSRFEGNYWAAYRGPDLDRDGTGDVAHRPVRLFSILIERNEPVVILLRSFLVQLLDAAEQAMPALTPETLTDARPAMAPIPRARRAA